MARQGTLVLGASQAAAACERIVFGVGLSKGAAVRRGPGVVADIRAFPGHIVCNAVSNVETLVALLRGCARWGSFWVDGPRLGRFTSIELNVLEAIAARHVASPVG